MAKLYFKYGAMGSSKSAQALITKFNYEERGMKVWMVKPSTDTRGDATTVNSRIGLKADADLLAPGDNVADAFRKRYSREDSLKPLNKAYFEVLTSTFARLKGEEEACLVDRKELLKDNLIHLMNDATFVTSISTGTGRLDRVQTRFKGVADAIQATLKGCKMGDNPC